MSDARCRRCGDAAHSKRATVFTSADRERVPFCTACRYELANATDSGHEACWGCGDPAGVTDNETRGVAPFASATRPADAHHLAHAPLCEHCYLTAIGDAGAWQ